MILVSSDNQDPDNNVMIDLAERHHVYSNSSNDEDKKDVHLDPIPIARKNMSLFNNKVTNDHIAIQDNLEAMSINDAHSEWGFRREKRPHNMVKLKGFRFLRKLKPYDSVRLIKNRAKPVSTVTDLPKKASNAGE